MQHERRSHRRLTAASLANRPPLRLRGGADVRLVDASPGGALILAEMRLVPGQRCTLRFDIGPNGWLASGTVRRCSLVAADEGGRLVYRIAVAFEKPEEGLWVVLTRGGQSLPGLPDAPGAGEPDAAG